MAQSSSSTEAAATRPAPGSGSQPLAGSGLCSLLLAAGVLLVFAGERLMAAGRWRTILSGLGVLLVVAALALRALRVAGASGDTRWVERRALDGMALVAAAVLLYFVQSDAFSFAFGGKAMPAAWPRLAVAAAVLWPALWLAGSLSLLLVELSYASMQRAPRLETGRVRDAFLSGLGLAFALVFALSLAYVASERDKRADLSYFRTTRPGEATRKLVRSLDQPVNVTYFFPAGSDVREELRGYLEDLAHESPNLVVKGLDQALDPAKAKELGVTGNGLVVFHRGARREQMQLGLELEQAKTQLRSLDKDVQKRLLQVARTGRTVYLTSGHGERTESPTSDTDKRGTIRELRAGLAELNYTLRDLGAAEGLGAEVPADAGVVMILGPQKPLLPEEIAALLRFVDRGGRLYIALDPEVGPEAAGGGAAPDLKALLAPLGVTFHPQALANDQQYARRLNQAIDKTNIVTNSYSSNPAVQTLGRLRAPTIYLGAGWLEEVPLKDRPKGVSVDMAVHAMPQTWVDLDGNFAFDPPKESRRAYDLAAAITRKRELPAGTTAGAADEARVFVVGDSDFLTDAAVLAVGNRYLVLDAVRWLIGDEAIAGETSSEVDQPLAHTRNQDVAWFYVTIFLAPSLVLGIGWLATRRTRRKKARPLLPGAAPSTPAKEAA